MQLGELEKQVLQYLWNASECHARWRLLPLDWKIRVRRLRFLPRLLRVASPQLLAMMQCSPDVGLSWKAVIIRDVSWVLGLSLGSVGFSRLKLKSTSHRDSMNDGWRETIPISTLSLLFSLV